MPVGWVVISQRGYYQHACRLQLGVRWDSARSGNPLLVSTQKEKNSWDGKLRHLLCLLAAAWQRHNAMTAMQVLHRMLFFLPSQQADCSVYVQLMMLFPEALGMPEELEVQLSSPPNLLPFCSLGGDGARWRPPSHSFLEFLAAWWPASGNRRWATWRCYLRHLTHKWIKKH